MKNKLIFASLLTAVATTAFAAQPQTGDQLHALQTLGVQIKTASDHAKAGKSPASSALKDFERNLHRLREPAIADAQLQQKYHAIAMLFGNLKRQAKHPEHAPAKPDKPTRAQIDLEVVTDHHGASCANALGMSENLPVSLTLGQAGNSRSDAWLRFEPHAGGNFRFTTDSAAPDPALEVFDGCGAAAAKIASNDDALGLDAAVSVSGASHKALFVHLTNSAQGGRVLLNVAGTTGAITGNVKDLKTGFTISNVQTYLVDSNGFYTGYSAYTDQGGNYSVAVDNPGDYYARADMGNTYVPEVYPGSFCFPGSFGIDTCDLAHAQTVTVASGATVSNINFALSTGQKIAGQVRDTSNQPLFGGAPPFAGVGILSSQNELLGGALTDNFGHYVFSVVPPGSYKLDAAAYGYGAAMFNHIACGGPVQTDCDLSQASLLTVTNQDVTGIDFELPQLAAIQGTVTDATSQQPLLNATIIVLDGNGYEAAYSYTDGSGHYTAGPLAIGSYYVETIPEGYFRQVFDGIDCASDCSQEVASATPVAITSFGQQAQADFHVDALPAVHGHVQDSASGLPLANVAIQLSTTPPGGGSFSWPVVTDSNGNYTLSGTPPGQYYVWAQSDDHIDELYSGIACEAFYPSYFLVTTACDSASATLLTIALGQTPGSFDFALDASSSITGQAITRAGPNSDLAAVDVQVSVYDAAGTLVATTASDALGNYFVKDLPSGTYFAYAQGDYWTQYIPQLWQQTDCVGGCDPTTGTPIPVAASTTASGIDFQLTRLDAVVGRVTNDNGDPISGALVDLFDSANGIYVGSGVADAQGYYASPGNLDNGYYVATEAGDGYVDQVYSGISCPLGAAYYGLCPFNNATAITLDGSATQPHIVDFVLQTNDPIFANGFE